MTTEVVAHPSPLLVTIVVITACTFLGADVSGGCTAGRSPGTTPPTARTGRWWAARPFLG